MVLASKINSDSGLLADDKEISMCSHRDAVGSGQWLSGAELEEEDGDDHHPELR